MPRPINKGLVTRKRIPWFRPQKNAITNQNQDNKNVTKRNKIRAVFVALPTGYIQMVHTQLHKNAISINKRKLLAIGKYVADDYLLARLNRN